MDAMGSLDGSKISIFPGWAPSPVRYPEIFVVDEELVNTSQNCRE